MSAPATYPKVTPEAVQARTAEILAEMGGSMGESPLRTAVWKAFGLPAGMEWMHLKMAMTRMQPTIVDRGGLPPVEQQIVFYDDERWGRCVRFATAAEQVAPT